MIRIRLVSLGPRVVLQAIPWHDPSGLQVTVAAKLTLDLVGHEAYDGDPNRRPGGVTAAFPSPPDPDSAESAPPPLPLAQITLRGHARSPRGGADGTLRTRLVARRGEQTLLDKSVLVHGERAHPGAMPHPFTEMPLVHERAPRSAWNPVGRALQHGDPPPNLVPDSPGHPFAAYAPVPAHWPSRTQLLAGHSLPAAVEPRIGSSFDRRYFLDAPHDQWVSDLACGDVIEAMGVSARFKRLVAVLPSWDIVATLRSRDGASQDVSLAPSVVAIDTDREVFAVTWRGTAACPSRSTDGLDIEVSAGPHVRTVAQAPAGPLVVEAATVAMRAITLPAINLVEEETTDSGLLERRPTMPFGAAVTATPNPPAPAMVAPAEPQLALDIAEPARMLLMTELPAIEVHRTFESPPEEGALSIPSGETSPAPPAKLAVLIETPMVEPSRVAENVEKLLAGSLVGESLRNADLAGAALAGAMLAGRDLRGARMPGANLDGARLAGANLDRADLSSASLRGADLVGASLEGANLDDAALSDAKLERANMARCHFDRARLDGASLQGANLEGANGDGASLRGTALAGSQGEGIRLPRADLSGANLDEIDWPDADLDGANLSAASLARATLPGVRLDGANLEGADLDSAQLRDASLVAARCAGARFQGADLRRADLRDARIDATALDHARTAGLKR